MMTPHRKGHIFIISAASGTGKTTLVSRLVQHHADIKVSISHTTRPPRTGEQHGKHYYFVSEEKFLALIQQGVFLEHAQVFGNYYGTSIMAVEELTKQGIDVILEIDVQGAAQIRKTLPEAISIFILPPNLNVLAERLHHRQTDNIDVIKRRLAEARSEIEQAHTFDYVIVNDDLLASELNLLHIIKSQQFRQPEQLATIEKVLQHH